jgi:hypothetical protein
MGCIDKDWIRLTQDRMLGFVGVVHKTQSHMSILVELSLQCQYLPLHISLSPECHLNEHMLHLLHVTPT